MVVPCSTLKKNLPQSRQKFNFLIFRTLSFVLRSQYPSINGANFSRQRDKSWHMSCRLCCISRCPRPSMGSKTPPETFGARPDQNDSAKIICSLWRAPLRHVLQMFLLLSERRRHQGYLCRAYADVMQQRPRRHIDESPAQIPSTVQQKTRSSLRSHSCLQVVQTNRLVNKNLQHGQLALLVGAEVCRRQPQADSRQCTILGAGADSVEMPLFLFKKPHNDAERLDVVAQFHGTPAVCRVGNVVENAGDDIPALAVASSWPRAQPEAIPARKRGPQSRG